MLRTVFVTTFTKLLKFRKRIDRVRDLFLIGAYSGLRFSDFSRLRVEGEKMLSITTQKTGEVVIHLTLPFFWHVERSETSDKY